VKINLLPDDYTPPEVKIEIKLQPYNGTKPRSPMLSGYVRITTSQLKQLDSIVTKGGKGEMYLRVALWDEGNQGGVSGVLEYKEFEGKIVQPEMAQEVTSIWY
jgi:hypothetical protein